MTKLSVFAFATAVAFAPFAVSAQTSAPAKDQAKPAIAQAAPKTGDKVQQKLDCTKAENKTKAECTVTQAPAKKN
jgi:hypothetical protein